MPAPHVIVALGGDSVAGDSTAIAAVAVVSMAIGYALLAGLWYFVFRRSPEDREAERRAEQARAEAVRQWRPATGRTPGPAAPDDLHPPAGGRVHVRPLHIDRPAGSRFRRR